MNQNQKSASLSDLALALVVALAMPTMASDTSFNLRAGAGDDDSVTTGMNSSMVGASPLLAQMATTYPAEETGALRNPLMGFRPYLNSWSGNPYTTVVHHYIRWNQIENNVNDSVQKIRDFCNAQWANLPANNVKVIPRVYIDWDSKSGNEYWPADLTPGDWTSQQFKDRVVRLIGRLGEAWDDDPRVAWVQTGIIGYWGEQESPVGVGQDGWAQRMGDAFTNAFENKKLVVRNMNHWPGYPMGVYWDSFGHPGQTNGSWNSIRNFNNQGRYLTQVIEGEVAYNWGQSSFDPLYGGEPTITLGNAQYTDNMIDVIRELHASALGWISSYKTDGSFGTDPDVVRANAARMQAEFGYRFHITEFASSARTEPGENLEVRFKVKNKGSAPFYENWPVAVMLIDETTRQIVWRATLPNVDIRDWQPGHNYNYTSRTYLTPAAEHEVTAALPLPTSLPSGQYLVGLSILEPKSRTPGVFFAVPNFFKQSQTQPLSRIGIGVDAGSHELTGVVFDHLVTDDTRYYTMNQAGPSHTLTLQPSALGTITGTPEGPEHVKDTGVQLTASGMLGYEFSSWDGALAGSTHNPAIIVMDADKTVSANYVAVATYTLDADMPHGSVVFDPPGGVYNAGTVVTVTATPVSGYNFAGWSGDLAGTGNPTTIKMDGNRTIVANTSLAGVETLPRAGWVTSASLANASSSNAIDGNIATRWSTGVNQADGQWFQVDMGAPQTFNTIVLDAGNSAGDYPRGYQVNVSDDGSNWGSPVSTGSGTSAVTTITFTTQTARYIRVTQTGSITGTWWSIHEFDVMVDSSLVSYTLTTSAPNGVVTLNPPGGIYPLGTVVTMTATPESGYTFASWSGGLGGTNNPATVTMNSNTAVTATFAPLTYTLGTSATHGAVTLDPPGGIYPAGAVVTVTAVPDSGYAFANWSGDLTGAFNSMALAMDANKSVTANFSPIGGLTSFRVNCGGPAYTAGDGSVFEADGTYNSGGAAYSTDSAISDTTDDFLYQTERWANSFGYNIPVANGDYEVTLMFAEINFSSAGRRVFNVAIESNQVIANLDIWARVGKDTAYHETHVVTVSDGQLNIAFSPVIENPKISAIRVEPLAGQSFRLLPPLIENGQLRLEWHGAGTLQTSTDLVEPWTDLPDAVSPYLSPTSDPARFFRLRMNSNPSAGGLTPPSHD